MKAVSPVVATILLIGLAVAGVVLAGYYYLNVMRQSAPKGAVLTVSNARFIYMGVDSSGARQYVLTASIVNTGGEPAFITRVELSGASGSWSNTSSITLAPGSVYENTWVFTTSVAFNPGGYYTLRVYYYDSQGSRSIGVPVLCETA